MNKTLIFLEGAQDTKIPAMSSSLDTKLVSGEEQGQSK
jgi:hypothetical protein